VVDNDYSISKVIDFGVAKALAQPLTERTVQRKIRRLLKGFEIISGQYMELKIDLDITLQYYHLNDSITL